MKKIIPLLLVLFILLACNATFFPSGYGETQENTAADSTQQIDPDSYDDPYYGNHANHENETARKQQQAEAENSRKTPWMPKIGS